MPQPTTRPLPTLLQKTLPLLAALATLGFAAARPASGEPPAFERRDGSAVDGQTIVQPTQPRRQVVAILPDRTTGRDWGLRYLREAVDDLNRMRPDAVFAVGDLVQGYSRDRAQVARWHEEYLAIIGRLTMPFYPTAGNHDLVSGGRDPKDRSFVDAYRRLFGPLHYAVELELASVVVLNTEDGGGEVQAGLSDSQLQWLEETLARLAARGRPILLLMHRPLWDHRPTRWDERVQPLLARHGVDFVIAGHYHSLQMLPPRDGIPYLIVGTCGGAVDQHPLAGQLQHLTHLVIDETGGIHPYHQIAGTTLPIDWILKADQDLAYRLKSDKGGVEIRGALPDPLGAPSAGAIELVVRNPLDRPIEARLAAAAEPSPWSVVDRDAGQPIERTWASRTPVDVFNPSTTDLASPFALALPAGTTSIAPGASATFRIEASCEPQATPPLPPPFDLVLAFPDSKGRAVPIHLRQRVPIARAVRIGASLEAAVEYPIAVWKWSEYDTLEENARARFAAPAPSDAVSGATPGDAAPIALEIAIETSDRVLSDDARPSDRASSLEDPLGDALRLVLGEDAEAREFLVTFADGAPRVRTVGADGSSLVPTTDVSGTVLAGKEGSRRIVLQVRGSALPEGARLEGLPVNLGVADNDETYHTQWRWLAPREIPARLTRE